MTDMELTQEDGVLNNAQNKFMTRVYGWMTFALCISGITAYFTANYAMANQQVFSVLFGKFFYVLAIAEIILVWYLSASIRKLSVGAATVAFVFYAVLNGVTLSSVFIVYQLSSLFTVFFVSAATFAAMAVYGTFTKTDVLSFGRYLSMALIGVIIASLANVILSKLGFNMGAFDTALSIITVVLFTGLTAYDAKKMLVTSQHAKDDDTFKKASILGALELYLDFINIFLSLLRLFGKRK